MATSKRKFDIGTDVISAADAPDYLVAILEMKQSFSGPDSGTPLTSVLCQQYEHAPRERQHMIKGASMQLLSRIFSRSPSSCRYFTVLARFVCEIGFEDGIDLVEKIVLQHPENEASWLRAKLDILGSLADAVPSRSLSFWLRILALDETRFAGICFNALLRIDFAAAVKVLPHLIGPGKRSEFAALLLDAASYELNDVQRSKLICLVQAELPACDALYTGPIEHWIRDTVLAVGH